MSKNGKAKTCRSCGEQNATARAWVKLAPVLAGIRALADDVEGFQADPDAAPLAREGGVSYVLGELREFLREQGGILAEAAASVVAG